MRGEKLAPFLVQLLEGAYTSWLRAPPSSEASSSLSLLPLSHWLLTDPPLPSSKDLYDYIEVETEYPTQIFQNCLTTQYS